VRFSEERERGTASRQFASGESIFNSDSNQSKMADNGRGNQLKLGYTHRLYRDSYSDRGIRALVILAFECRLGRRLPTVVLAPWQAARRSSRTLEGHGKRRQQTTEDGRKCKMCDNSPHKTDYTPNCSLRRAEAQKRFRSHLFQETKKVISLFQMLQSSGHLDNSSCFPTHR
jgi:hypothetical protein